MDISPDVTFAGSEFARLQQPIVYVLRGADGAALYVGMSAKGVVRPFDPSHHAIGAVDPDQQIEIYLCGTQKAAAMLERDLIVALKPARNNARWYTRATMMKPARRRPESIQMRGIKRHPSGWRAFVRVKGKLYSRCFPPQTGMLVMRRWREETRHRVTHGSHGEPNELKAA